MKIGGAIIRPCRDSPDLHVHTFRCGHAGGAVAGLRPPGDRAGLSEIAFTDHIPLYFLPEADRDPKLAMAEAQFDGYVREVEDLRSEFRGTIDVRLGLEADYAEDFEEELARWLDRADWDVVLGSVHWVDGGWIDDPATSPARFAREGIEALYERYYRLLSKAAGTGLFDVLTHFDLPKKHGHRPPFPLAEAEGAAIAAARRSGLAVEISSAGLRKPVGEAYPEPRLLSAIVEAGIPVTFSSDAHAPAEVGWGYEKTLPLARAAGVTEFVTFEKRRPIRHRLPR